MPKARRIPVALTIAGSDSGGGAGIQADLQTFSALGVHGTCAVTCLTAQSPRRVTAIAAMNSAIVQQQIATVCEDLDPSAAKTGMLFSARIVRAVAQSLPQKIPLVIDPVMVATSGTALRKGGAIEALCRDLLPRAVLVTPNLPEAAVLTGEPVSSISAARRAARVIFDRFGVSCLVKGGHLTQSPEIIDFFFDGQNELEFRGRRIRGVMTHGTGCTLSAAIAGHLALGRSVIEAITLGKEFITTAIAQSQRIGPYSVLGWTFPQPRRALK